MSHQLLRNEFGNPADSGNVLSLEEATKLLDDWVKNERLKLHMKQVAHLMKCWTAECLQASDKTQHQWYIAGLLHDADWDQWPADHCRIIIEELERRHQDPSIMHAIASHGPRVFGVIPISDMDKMLYAFDELSGLIHAYSLMRPQGYSGMELKGVKKRLKEKSFAANVSREDIDDACEKANINLDELIQFIIDHQHEVND